MNVRGYGVVGKIEEIGKVFDSINFDLLALSEQILRGNDDVMFGWWKEESLG